MDGKLKMTEINILHSNISSIQNKRESLHETLLRENIHVAIVSEMNTKKCPKLRGYRSFSHLVDKKFHGVSIFVSEYLAAGTLRIHDMSSNELVHIRLDNVTPALNIVGLYMDVESRDSKENMAEKVNALKEMSDEIIARGEALVMIGDINRPSIVKEYDQMTPGTRMFADWIAEGSVVMVNDRSVPTRRDPATGSESLLDVCLVSSNVCRNVTEFHVDSERKVTPYAKSKRGRKYTDHYAVTLKISLPESKSRRKMKSRPVINFGNKEGWPRYTEISDRRFGEILDIVNSESHIDVKEKQIERVEKEIQTEAFGIIWKKPLKKKKKLSQEQVRDRVRDEYKEMEEMIQEGMTGKDLNEKMYNLKSVITGPKIERTEASALCHPETKEVIVNRDEIKRVVLEHNIKILKKNEVPDSAKAKVEEKKKVHERIMREEDKDSWGLDLNCFNEVVRKMTRKGKRLYWPLTKSGAMYKFAIYKYLELIVKTENIPDSFLDTSMTMIWKKKGSPLDLNNMRFIHGKEYRPRVLEAIVVEKMKSKIIEATPNIQIGGMPGHSSSEHLFLLKTWMRLKEYKKENGIFSVFDLSKFFDKESLLDCVNQLNDIGVDNKSYRLWYKLNENTRISVKTSVGETEKATVRDTIGQGSVGAPLVSSMNIGRTVSELDKTDIEPSYIGRLKVSSVVFQDDIAKFSDSVENARVAADKLDKALRDKQLSVNYSKSKNLIIGSKKFRKDTLKEMEENPIKIGDEVMEHSSQEKYLGDVIHEDGCEASITATINERIKKLYSKCEEIVKIAEHPALAALKESRSAFKMFEASIIPALLFNAETWIGFNEKHEKLLQDFQDRFVRRVFQVHVSTPKAILNYDSGMVPMRLRVAEKKFKFVRQIMQKDDNNLAKQAIFQEIGINRYKFRHPYPRFPAMSPFTGLLHELSQMMSELIITPIYDSKQEISRRIKLTADWHNKMAMWESKKVSDRIVVDVQEEKEEISYLKRLPLALGRVMFRFRARAIQGVKYNTKSSHRDLSCRLCAGSTETQEHLLICPGTETVKRGLKLDVEDDFIKFWQRISVKLQGLRLST